MATQVQFRRGTSTQNNNFIGANGELSVNLSNYSIRLHDGVTAGGYEMARANMSNANFGATVLPSANTTYNLGSASFKFANIFSQSFNGALVGNADTATQLATPRNINGIAFDGTQDITIEAAIDKTLTIGTGLSGGTFDGATDVTIALENSANFTDTNLLKWDSGNGQFINSLVTDNGTTASVGGNLTVTGDLLVQGSTTTISTTNLVVSDKLIVIGDGTETTQGADGAGFNIGSTGVSLTYDLANTSWTSSESFNLATGKTYKINGTTVIGSTSLGIGIVSSSLTSVGTITTGVWNGTIISPTYGGTGINNGSNTLTLSGNVTYTGGHTLELVTSAVTSVTLPTVGTLATLDGIETLTNKTLNAPTINNASLDSASIDFIFLRNTSGTDITKSYVKSGDTSTSSLLDHSLTIDIWATTLYSAVDYIIYSEAVNGEKEITKFTVLADGNGDVWMTEQNTLRTDTNNPSFEIEARWITDSVYIVLIPSSNSNDVIYKLNATGFVA
jgi:hypothetical protein